MHDAPAHPRQLPLHQHWDWKAQRSERAHRSLPKPGSSTEICAEPRLTGARDCAVLFLVPSPYTCTALHNRDLQTQASAFRAFSQGCPAFYGYAPQKFNA